MFWSFREPAHGCEPWLKSHESQPTSCNSRLTRRDSGGAGLELFVAHSTVLTIDVNTKTDTKTSSDPWPWGFLSLQWTYPWVHKDFRLKADVWRSVSKPELNVEWDFVFFLIGQQYSPHSVPLWQLFFGYSWSGWSKLLSIWQYNYFFLDFSSYLPILTEKLCQ